MPAHSRAQATARPPALPPVRIAEGDYDRLLNLAAQDGPGADLLARELERAQVVRDGATRTAFVRLGSWVEYRDQLTGKLRRVQVTPPDGADIDEGRLSVLSPVGAALIGLAAGDTFGWTAPDGRPRLISIESVGGG